MQKKKKKAFVCCQLSMKWVIVTEKRIGLNDEASFKTTADRNRKHLSEGVGHIVIKRLNFSSVAVAALERPEHGGDGEGQQEEPDDDGDLGRLLQHFDEVPPAEVDHVEVAIEGKCDEEGDAGSTVEEEHEEQRLAHQAGAAASHAIVVMKGLGRKTGHQQEVGHHNIEEENTFVLPELESKTEQKKKNKVYSAPRITSLHHILIFD